MSKLYTLSVKLAKENFFGKDIMKRSTVKGTRELPALPPIQLMVLKSFLHCTMLCSPQRMEKLFRSDRLVMQCFKKKTLLNWYSWIQHNQGNWFPVVCICTWLLCYIEYVPVVHVPMYIHDAKIEMPNLELCWIKLSATHTKLGCLSIYNSLAMVH